MIGWSDYRIGLLFLLTIGLIEAKILIIGYEKNKDIGLMQTKDNQTPNGNQQQSTIKRTKNKSRTRRQYKAQHKNTKKEQKVKHNTTPNRQHTNQ